MFGNCKKKLILWSLHNCGLENQESRNQRKPVWNFKIKKNILENQNEKEEISMKSFLHWIDFFRNFYRIGYRIANRKEEEEEEKQISYQESEMM